MIEYLYNERLWKWSLVNFAIFCWLLSIIVIVVNPKKSRPEFRKILVFAGFSYLLEHVSSNGSTKYLLTDGTNASWYHIGTPVLFFLMTRFYTVYLAGEKNHRLDFFLPLIFTIIAVVNAFYNGGFSRFPTVTIGLYSVAGIVLGVGYFIHLLRALNVVRLETEPLFWISSGMLIYYSANFLLWAGVTFLSGDRNLFNSIYRINAWMTILLNAMFIISILTARPIKPELNTTSNNQT